MPRTLYVVKLVKVTTMGLANSFRSSVATRSQTRSLLAADTSRIQVPTERRGIIVTNRGTESGIALSMPLATPVGGIRPPTPKPCILDAHASDRIPENGSPEARFCKQVYLNKLRRPTPRRNTRAAALRSFDSFGIKQYLSAEVPAIPPTQSPAAAAAEAAEAVRKTYTGRITRVPTPARSKRGRVAAPCQTTVSPSTPRATSGDGNLPSPTLNTCRNVASSKRKLPAPSLSQLPPPSKSSSSIRPPSPAMPVRRKKRAWHKSESGMGALTCGAIRTVVPRSGSEVVRADRCSDIFTEHFTQQQMLSSGSILAQNIGAWEGTGLLPLCAERGCLAPASYGFMESGRVDFCPKHAVVVGMVDLLDRCWGPDQNGCNHSTSRICCSTWSLLDDS